MQENEVPEKNRKQKQKKQNKKRDRQNLQMEPLNEKIYRTAQMVLHMCAECRMIVVQKYCWKRPTKAIKQ